MQKKMTWTSKIVEETFPPFNTCQRTKGSLKRFSIRKLVLNTNLLLKEKETLSRTSMNLSSLNLYRLERRIYGVQDISRALIWPAMRIPKEKWSRITQKMTRASPWVNFSLDRENQSFMIPQVPQNSLIQKAVFQNSEKSSEILKSTNRCLIRFIPKHLRGVLYNLTNLKFRRL